MNKKLVLLFGSFLLIVILGQGYYMYQLSSRLEALSVSESVTNNHSPAAVFQDDWFNGNIWDQFEKMHEMQDRINKMFGNSALHFNAIPNFDELFNSGSMTTAIDVIDTDDQYIIKVNLQDADETSINISVDDNKILTISAKTHKEETQENLGAGIQKHQLMSGQFQQSLSLPPDIDSMSMKTEFENGILSIYFDKNVS